MIDKAIVIYWSKTGNTEKAAKAIYEALKEKNIEVDIKEVQEAKDINYFDYDLVCIGSPTYQWSPPEEVDKFLQEKYEEFKDYIELKSPKRPNKHTLIFCTYSGPHTGKNEAIPVIKYIGQFFEHLGFNVLDEIYILSENHGSEKASIDGKMGDIRGLPTEEDLLEVKQRVKDKI